MRRANGFTLVEMVVTILVIGLGATLVAPLIRETVDMMLFEQMRSDLTRDARLAVDRVRLDLKQVKDQFSVIKHTPTEFTYFDTNNILKGFQVVNNTSTPPKAPMQLNILVGTGPGAATVTPAPLSQYLQQATFTYYDENGNSIAAPLDPYDFTPDRTRIRTIRVEARFINTDLDTIYQGSFPMHIQTEIAPENLRR